MSTNTLAIPTAPRSDKVDPVEWAELVGLVEEMLGHGWTPKKIARHMGYASGTGIYPFLYGYNLPEQEKRDRLRELVEKKRAGQHIGASRAPTQRSQRLLATKRGGKSGVKKHNTRKRAAGNGHAPAPTLNGANFVKMSYDEAARHLDEAHSLLSALLQIQEGATTLAQKVAGNNVIDFGESVEPAVDHIAQALAVLRN